MRVALDATPLTLSSGGLPRYVTELSVALAQEFPEDVYALLSDQPVPMPERAPANLIRGPEPRDAAERRWWLWGIQQAIKQTGAQVFHGTNFEVPYLGQTPAILTIHDLSPWRDPAWHEEANRVRQRTPWLVRLRRARMILTVSEAVRREVIDHFGVSPDLVRAVPLAASHHFRPLPPTSPAPQPFFLFVATLEPRKNVAGLVEGWRESHAATKADLVIAGRNRADFTEIQPCEGLHFLGEVPDPELPRLYSDALAFVYPTHYEGFGLPVLEAMQCGCPVITSRDPAVMEVAGGAAIHTADSHEIAEAMCALASNPLLRNVLRGCGLQRASAFSWAKTAHATREIYFRGAGGRPQMNVVMLSPEAPYPLQGGGAFRTASLLHYFARFAEVDLILISEGGRPALLPAGLVRSQQVIPLAPNSRSLAARVLRNAGRAIRGVPPLVDRLAGLEPQLARALGDRHYDLGIVEHFWCASYVEQLRLSCAETVLDLHNIESMLHERCSALSNGVVGAGHRRFASAARELEKGLLPRYSSVLVASEEDARLALELAPGTHVRVYPNALPWIEKPRQAEMPRIVFSANFEYHPDIDAVRFLVQEIWPEVRRRHPDLRLRLVGRGERFIRHLLPRDSGIETTGPVEDALSEIAQAQIIVAPLRAGSEYRVKILEAWAAERAVVATPLAAEGLKSEDGVNIVLASDAAAFASAIDRILCDSTLKGKLGLGGRQLFEMYYSWEAAWTKLDFNPQLMHGNALNGYT